MDQKERKKETKKEKKTVCPGGSMNVGKAWKRRSRPKTKKRGKKVLDLSEGGNDLKKGYIKDKEKVHDVMLTNLHISRKKFPPGIADSSCRERGMALRER